MTEIVFATNNQNKIKEIEISAREFQKNFIHKASHGDPAGTVRFVVTAQRRHQSKVP